MSCPFEVPFPKSKTVVEEAIWSSGRQTMFERFVTLLLNIVQPSELPLDQVINVTFTKQNNLSIEPKGDIKSLLMVAKQYEIPIAITALLPFTITVIMGIFLCFACTCLSGAKDSDEDKIEARKKLRAVPVMFLFFSATILVLGVYTVTSSLSMDSVTSEMLDNISKSANYSEVLLEATKKVVDRLVTTDFNLFVKTLKNASSHCTADGVAVGSQSQNNRMDFNQLEKNINSTFMYQNNTVRKCLTQSNEYGPCGQQIVKLLRIVQEVQQTSPPTASDIGDLARRATGPLTAIRQLFDSLSSSISPSRKLAETLSNYSAHIKEYNTYRQMSVIAWCALACAVSFLLFGFAVLLLFVFGPEGGRCHFRVSEKCLKKLLGLSTCIAYWTALLGSLVFLVLFTVGANVHYACRRLEDVEGIKTFIGPFSNATNDYLRWLVNSSFVKSGGISSSLLDAQEVNTVIKDINVTDIIHKCEQRKTIFVILNWKTSNLTLKLTNLFITSVQALKRRKRLFSLLNRKWGTLGAVSRSSYDVQGEDGELHRRFSEASSRLPFGAEILLSQDGSLSHSSQPRNFTVLRSAKSSPFSKLSGRLQRTKFVMTEWLQSSAIKLKQLLPEQEEAWPYLAEYDTEKMRLHLRNRQPAHDDTQFGKSLSRRYPRHSLPSSSTCKALCDDLRLCKANIAAQKFTTYSGDRCFKRDEIKSQHNRNMDAMINICNRIKPLCTGQKSSNPSKEQFLRSVPTYTRHVDSAFKSEILRCDELTYFVRSAFNSTCGNAFHKINCWSVAVGLWCLLAAFTAYFGMSARKMLLGHKPQKNTESSMSTNSL